MPGLRVPLAGHVYHLGIGATIKTMDFGTNIAFFKKGVFNDMDIINLLPKAKQIVETCMSIHAGDVVFVVTDNQSRNFAELLVASANSIGADASMGIITPRKAAGNEPPKPIAAAMKEATHVIVIMEKISLAHSTAIENAMKNNAKIGLMTGRSEEFLRNLEITVDDINSVRKRAENVAEILSNAQVIKVNTAAGTELEMDVKGRPGVALYPMPDFGSFTGIPEYAEAAVSPIEGTTNGKVVIDGTVVGIGIIKEPITLTITDGRVIRIEGGEQAEQLSNILEKGDTNAFNLAELGIGLSHIGGRYLQGTRVDARILGTAHVGLGRSDQIGGKVYSSLHMDAIFLNPTIYIDGKVIVNDNKLII